MEQKILQAIRKYNVNTPERVAEITGIPCEDIENILLSLESRGVIVALRGGSKKGILQFEFS